MDIIGRRNEQRSLNERYDSGQPEFVAVYGRRRVGKTYLISETFRGRIDFYATGVLGGKPRRQIETFTASVAEAARRGIAPAGDWFAAFGYLREYIQELIARMQGERILLFLDELPWFDTQKSEFVPALDYFWNSFASKHPEVMLIVCGSATSWMSKHILNNTGGLHNRVTHRIPLRPFSLSECRDFFESKGFVMSPHQLIETYMVFGGVPFYLNQFSRSKSHAQNINDICFKDGGALKDEFNVLYASLFRKAGRHTAVVKALASKNKGLTRDEVAKLSKINKGGTLSSILNELELSGFIRAYKPFGKKQRGRLYQLIDPFSLFYLNFMDGSGPADESFWIHTLATASRNAWSGYAFEQVCLWHTAEIKDALGISGMASDVSGWRSERESPGMQVDLVLDRSDGVINLCEMKYSMDEYVINKKYSTELRNRRAAFIRETKTRKAVHLTFVTVYGLLGNEYAQDVQSEVTADMLFGQKLNR
jgi:AAA+ ATPase superfamily predicted ATPase